MAWRLHNKCLLVLLATIPNSVRGAEASETTGIDPDGFVVPKSEVCNGTEVVYEDCDLPECTECACKPIDCEFGDWSDWGSNTGCNGLVTRSREIAQKNNECGKPCDGPKEDTKADIPPECLASHIEKNCKLGPWSVWSHCANNDVDQKTRHREIEVKAEGLGKPCADATVETYPCGHSQMPIDCIMGDWQEWTQCSVTCGGGINTRMRRKKQDAEHGGKPCGMVLLESAECSNVKCDNAVNCTMSDWSPWSGCTDDAPNERFRHRAIATLPSNGGAACPQVTQEVGDCASASNSTCTFGDWSNWTACDVTCGGGQSRRHRILQTWTPSCDTTSTEASAPCNTQACSKGAADCKFGAWGEWGPPAPPCGNGVKERTRKVVKQATEGGVGCVGPLSELSPVVGPECTVIDCVWGDWVDWGGCTASCGGGTHRRTRQIAIPPRHGGTLCEDKDFAEIQPCNTKSCDAACVNGTWGLWGMWSTCSSSCGDGSRTRRREVAQSPNSCGIMPSGPEQEIELCNASSPCEPKVDCTLSEWGMWGTCSRTCFGVRERNRLVAKFPSGGGKQCEKESLKDIQPCNPAWKEKPPSSCEVLPMKNCTLDEWSPWTECPVTCGGGQHTRMRHIIQPPSGGGTTCTESLSQTRSCNTNKCGSHCIDCHWGQWSEWGACTGCQGQKYRNRAVEQLPNHCGARCQEKVAKETTPCTGNCTSLNYCVWSDWGEYTDCSMTCGAATKKRQRSLRVVQQPPPGTGYIFKGKQMMCGGTQFDLQACEGMQHCGAGCIPQNCVFDEWSDWQAPQCTGLCQRQRVIRINNNECGIPCKGDLIATRRCNTTCDEPQDCLIGNWGSWSHCPTMYAQRYRVRAIKVHPANDGEQCVGPLRETTSCMEESLPVADCGFTDWSPWGACTKTCNNGWHYRTRAPNSPAPKGAGAMCEGSLKEIASCGRVSCEGEPRDCVLGQWGSWSPCLNGNQMRSRVVTTEAIGNGNPCVGSLSELKGCAMNSTVNCAISPWTSWDACDMTCGGGQQMRHRTIWKHPKNGGTACPTNTVETQACSTQDCGVIYNCTTNAWSDWGSCSTTCGVGQTYRQRGFAHLRAEGGNGCTDELKQTKTCGSKSDDCEPQECKWDVWSDWGKCSRTCGGGTKKRSRGIKTNAQPGGKPCISETMTEIEPCAVRDCNGKNCIDGKWADWGAWEPCSQTCGGGLTWRSRKIAVTATDCGAAALGPEQEVASCNKDVACEGNKDCEFVEWGDWGACSETCHGMERRKRTFKAGSGNGQWCSGALEEYAPCNPNQGQKAPTGCPDAGQKVDCSYHDWQDWTACSKSCGGGQAQRSRTIKSKAMLGGKSCVGGITETGPCATTPCLVSDAPVNCSWQSWGDWGACEKCAGTQRRSRVIAHHASNGGALCVPGESKQVRACPRSCHDALICSWQDWGAWSGCSVTCGSGKRSRKRSLVATPQTGTRLYEQAGVKVDRDEPIRLQELAAAFAAGMVSLIVGLAAVRSIGAAVNRPRPGEVENTERYELGELEREEALE